MSVPTRDRVRASRLRKRDPATLTADERDWLAAYPARGTHAVREVEAPELERPPAPAPSPLPDAPPDPRPPDDEYRVIDFGVPAPSPSAPGASIAPHAPPEKCKISKCPRCKDVTVAVTCGTTGEPVWPRMSEEGAQGLAGLVLSGIAMIARIFGRAVEFTLDDRAMVGKAVREVMYRRAGGATAFDDLFMLSFALTAVATKVASAPRLPAPPARPSKPVAVPPPREVAA